MANALSLQLLKATDTPIIVIDAEKLVYANRLFCSLLDVLPEKIINQPLSRLLTDDPYNRVFSQPAEQWAPGRILSFNNSAAVPVSFAIVELTEPEDCPGQKFIRLSEVLTGGNLTSKNDSLLSELHTIQDTLFGLTGQDLFVKLSAGLAQMLECEYVYISRLAPNNKSVYVLGGYELGKPVKDFSYDLQYTPCEKVIGAKICLINSAVQKMYPKDELLVTMSIEAYIGVPLYNRAGKTFGLINALRTKSFNDAERAVQLLNLFSSRISIELEKFAIEEEIKKHESRYHSLFDRIADAVFIIRRDTDEIIDANSAACRLTGRDHESLKKLQHKDVCLTSIKRADSEISTEAVYLHTDGSQRQTFLRRSALDENTDYFIATDVTQFRKITEELIESEERYTTVLNESPNMVLIHQMGKIIFVNRRIFELTGYSAEEIIGNSLLNFIPEDQHAFVNEQIAKHEQDIPTTGYEVTIFGKNHHKFTLLVNAHKIFINNEAAVVAILTDITELEENQFFQSVLLELSEIALYSKSSEEFYQSMYELITKVLIVKNFFIALIYPQTEEIEFVFWADQYDENPGLVPMGKGLTEYVYRTNKPLSADKNTTKLLEEANEIEVIGSDSFEWIGVPMNNEKGVPFGVLVAQNYSQEHLLGPRQLKLLEFVSQQVSLIIQRKNAEAALRKNEDRFRKIFSNATIGIYRTTFDGYLLLANKALAEMLGYASEEELLNKNVEISSFFDQVSRNKFLSEIQETGSITGKEYKWKKRTGEDIFVRESAQIIKDEENNQIYFEGLVENITDKKFAEVKLREQQEQYFAFFHNSEQAAVVFKVQQDKLNELSIEMINRYALSMLGVEGMIEAGTPAHTVFDSESLGKFTEAIQLVSKTNKTFSIEYKSAINSHIYLTHFFKISRQLFAFTAIDITEEKNAQTKLVEARNKAEEVNRLKTAFLSSISHELRTPLMGIMGNSEILMENIEEPELKSVTDSILRSGQRLYETVSSILSISNLDGGKTTPVFSRQKIAPIVESVWKTQKPYADRKHLQLDLILQNTDIFAETDIQMFVETVAHIVNNAIKFTHKGGISLMLQGTDEEYRIIVKDSGIGIAPDKLDLIFEEFRQESEGLSRTFEGSGLGLSIAKRYATILGATITVTSKKGFGSEFTITFGKEPVKHTASEPKLLPVRELLPVNHPDEVLKNILLVENDELNISVIRAFVKNRYNIFLSTSGNEALNLLRKYKFDAILLDINLGSGISGLEVIKIAKTENILPNIPVIASTAFAMAGDKEEFLKEGCTHYISKPFTKAELLGLLNTVFQ